MRRSPEGEVQIPLTLEEGGCQRGSGKEKDVSSREETNGAMTICYVSC